MADRSTRDFISKSKSSRLVRLVESLAAVIHFLFVVVVVVVVTLGWTFRMPCLVFLTTLTPKFEALLCFCLLTLLFRFPIFVRLL